MDSARECSTTAARRGDRADVPAVARQKGRRKMSEKELARSGFAAFVPRARLLRLIGSELISDDVVAITELVKNAHDADATFISLQFVNVTGDAGEIVVRDDGAGMDRDTLLGRWMQP